MKYKKDKQTKLYIVFILQPKWPNSTDGKLHGLSMANIPPNKMLEIAEIYNEVVSSSKKVKRLDIAKIKIDEASKVFYTSEIKTEKNMTKIQNELLNPLITFTYKKIHPYLVLVIIIFLLTFILALLILIILIKKIL